MTEWVVRLEVLPYSVGELNAAALASEVVDLAKALECLGGQVGVDCTDAIPALKVAVIVEEATSDEAEDAAAEAVAEGLGGTALGEWSPLVVSARRAGPVCDVVDLHGLVGLVGATPGTVKALRGLKSFPSPLLSGPRELWDISQVRTALGVTQLIPAKKPK